ncbi:MAG: tetratricopeptide repeat protein [Anaerolineales bacterium]|nr:tetratricopeptide repeat protein [Anaerolineales bacterium]
MAKISLRAYNREIETMLDRGQVDEVVAHCLHILKTYPKHLDTYRLLGKAYLEMKKYGDAVDIFSRVLVCAPSDFVSHVGMGIIRDEENKLDDAIWHMERAFETQPSNAAVQSELQRLYTSRGDSTPPRIRMTRGALAQMYVKGELYPQAISEIKSVLAEDPGRSDMSALLAKAHYKSGQKTDAAEVASSLLRRYPYCYDANAVLVEIFSADKPENVQAYRQRIIELDPYAAHVSGSIFDTSKAPDSALSIEKLDWSGQPVGMPADWRESRGISLEPKDEPEPAWLYKGFETETQAPPQLDSAAVAPSDDNIPDFLKDAGWGQSTGEFDESKASLLNEEETLPPTAAAPLVAGEMPDWVKQLKPAEDSSASAPAQAPESIPDWMNRIDPSILPGKESTALDESPDWMKDLGQPASAAESAPALSNEPDWLTSLGGADANTAAQSTSAEQPDWLKSFGGEDKTSQPAAAEQPDWMKPIADEEKTSQPSATEQPDWMRSFDAENVAQPIASDEQPDWLKHGESEPAISAPAQPAEEFDFLNEIGEQPKADAAPAVTAPSDTSVMNSQTEDDAFAWLESLAVKQGSTEGLLMKPEERSSAEPEWVKQAKGLTDEPQSEAAVPPPVMPEAIAEATASVVEEPAKASSAEDDAFAWLESLAVKQGSTEGLLMKPEERSSDEPEWVKQAKESVESAPVETPVAQEAQPAVDTSAWLNSLDQETPASEPVSESRADETAMWLKSLDAETPASEPVSESRADETAMWLKSLDEPKAEPVSGGGDVDVSSWLQNLEESETTPEPVAEPAASDDLPSWLQSVDEGEAAPVAETELPVEASVDDQAELEDAPRLNTGSLPGWLSGVDEEEKQSLTGELPSWLSDDSGEAIAEPTKIEPTRAEEWQPAEMPAPVSFEEPKEEPKAEPKPAPRKPAVKKAEPRPTTPVPTYQEPVTRKATGMLTLPVDMTLGNARNELSRSNIPGALETYSKLIKKGKYLDEVIFDLREALYRYPVEVSIWQSLGDAYMRANRLQDALDSYTKAEELLR